MKKLISLFVVLFGSIAFLISFRVSHSVEIDAPIEAVWEYASNSSNAKEWSVFFDHISALPGIDDGKIGSVRRCYRRADESGPTWDEEVIKVIPLEFREIRTYNLQNFKEEVLHKGEFRVFQKYESLGPEKSKLTFSSKMKNPLNVFLAYQLLPMASESTRIFGTNLENIKAAVEAQHNGTDYIRIHPYETYNSISDIGE